MAISNITKPLGPQKQLQMRPLIQPQASTPPPRTGTGGPSVTPTVTPTAPQPQTSVSPQGAGAESGASFGVANRLVPPPTPPRGVSYGPSASALQSMRDAQAQRDARYRQLADRFGAGVARGQMGAESGGSRLVPQSPQGGGMPMSSGVASYISRRFGGRQPQTPEELQEWLDLMRQEEELKNMQFERFRQMQEMHGDRGGLDGSGLRIVDGDSVEGQRLKNADSMSRARVSQMLDDATRRARMRNQNMLRASRPRDWTQSGNYF